MIQSTRFWIANLGLVLGICASLQAHGGRFRPASPSGPPAATGGNLPARPVTGARGGAGAPVAATPGGASAAATGPDTTGWEYWWNFNADPYLDLRRKVFEPRPETGTSDALTGLKESAVKTPAFRPTNYRIERDLLPALEAGLKSGKKDIVTGSMLALAKIGHDPERMVSLFRPFLKEELEIAETAALACGILQSPKALDTLIDLVRDTPQGRRMTGREIQVNPRVRSFAAYGLGLIGHELDKAPLKSYLQSILWDNLTRTDHASQDLAVSCVIALGLLKPEDPSELVTKLLAFMQEDFRDHRVRAHVPTAVARLLQSGPYWKPRQDAAALFLQLMQSVKTEAEVRQSCTQALGILVPGGSPLARRSIEALITAATEDSDRMVRRYAIISLAYISADGGPMAPMVQGRALPFMLRQLDHAATLERPWYGLALGLTVARGRVKGFRVWPNSMVSLVRDRFRNTKAPIQRAAYAISLALMRHEGSEEMIYQAMLKTKEPEFRGYCALALGLMEAREYRNEIRAMMAKARRQPQLLLRTATGLGLMQDRDSVPALVALIRPEKGGPTTSLAVLAAAANALGFIGDERSLEPLAEVLIDEKQQKLARAFAAVALGKIGSKEILPWNHKIAADLNYAATVDTLTDPSNSTGILDLL